MRTAARGAEDAEPAATGADTEGTRAPAIVSVLLSTPSVKKFEVFENGVKVLDGPGALEVPQGHTRTVVIKARGFEDELIELDSARPTESFTLVRVSATGRTSRPMGSIGMNKSVTFEKWPSGRISVADKQTFEDSSLTLDVVLTKIQSAYMSRIKDCYRRFLRKDRSARGKVILSLTINETGRTTKASAHGLAGEVDDCISNLMSSWRFPIPKDERGEAIGASFAITLQMAPD